MPKRRKKNGNFLNLIHQGVSESGNAFSQTRNGNPGAKIEEFGGKVVKFKERQKPKQNGSIWYKIKLFHGKKYRRVVLLQRILNYIKQPLIPFAERYDGENMIFYVDDEITANAICSADNQFDMQDGFKLRIKKARDIPEITIDDELKTNLQYVMSKNFSADDGSLNLTRFHRSRELLDIDASIPLCIPGVMEKVFDIIEKSMPNLRVLNLSNNGIFQTHNFIFLKKVAPELISLDLGNNMIPSLDRIQYFKGLNLEILVLEKNPLCALYKNKTDYICRIKSMFKNLKILDGIKLPPPMKFGIEEPSHVLPTSRENFFCNEELKSSVKDFLEQYFKIYDDQISRNDLLNVYDANAIMSMNAYHIYNREHQLGHYLSESRNLCTVTLSDSRKTLLRRGSSDIINLCNHLPKTKHNFSSFLIDFADCTDNMITVIVCGVFTETDSKEEIMRSFSRTFIINTDTFKIINDMLTITLPSKTIIEKFQENLNDNGDGDDAMTIPTNNMLAKFRKLHIQPPSTSAGPSNISEPDADKKRQMIKDFAEKTTWNLSWSEICLQALNWDFKTAMESFHAYNYNNQIPEEAFDK